MSTIIELEEKVKELLDEIETLKREKKNEEFEYLFETGEKYWCISSDGSFFRDIWDTTMVSYDRYSQGNIFKTKQEAERERDKRALLVRFRQFRDKCNGDWKPFEGDTQFYLNCDTTTNVITINCVYFNKSFALFGYFKNKPDCERAVELFGDEIKRLFVEE